MGLGFDTRDPPAKGVRKVFIRANPRGQGSRAEGSPDADRDLGARCGASRARPTPSGGQLAGRLAVPPANAAAYGLGQPHRQAVVVSGRARARGGSGRGRGRPRRELVRPPKVRTGLAGAVQGAERLGRGRLADQMVGGVRPGGPEKPARCKLALACAGRSGGRGRIRPTRRQPAGGPRSGGPSRPPGSSPRPTKGKAARLGVVEPSGQGEPGFGSGVKSKVRAGPSNHKDGHQGHPGKSTHPG